MGRARKIWPDYRPNHAGIYCYRVPMVGTRKHRWVPTGQASMEEAKKVVATAGVDRLVMIANAQAMTPAAISMIVHGHRVTALDVMNGWHQWMLRRVAPRTLQVYSGIVAALLETTNSADKALGTITEDDLDNFVNAPNLKLKSRGQRLAALTPFYRYAQANAYSMGNPLLLVDIKRREMTVAQMETKHYQPMTEEEYVRIRAHHLMNQFWRDAIVLAYCCGLRLVDCCTFEWASFTKEEIVVFVKKHRSGGKRLALPLSDPLIARPELLELIERLLATPVTERHEQYVWPEYAAKYYGHNGHAMGSPFAARLRKSSLKIQGKSFHGFRVAFARRLLEAGTTIEGVARRMAHSSTDTTRIYLGETLRPAHQDDVVVKAPVPVVVRTDEGGRHDTVAGD